MDNRRKLVTVLADQSAPAAFSLPFSDAFTRADGAIGGNWTGATWTIASNQALNTPAAGSELLPNPGFEGVYEDESSGGGGTVMLAPNWNNSNAETDGTDTLNESATVHGGSKSQLVTVNANNEGVTTATNVLSAAGWYVISAWINITSGAVKMQDAGNTIFRTLSTTGSWINNTAAGRIAAARAMWVRSSGGAANFLVDDASAKALTLTSLFATLPDLGVTDVTAQVVLPVSPVNGGGNIASQAGHILNLDSLSSPTRFVIAYFDGPSSEVKLVSYVSGTYTQATAGNATFNAAHNLKVVKSGDNYSVYYGAVGSEAQMGTTQAITGMTGTLHGLFSTDASARFDSYQLAAT